MALALCVGGGEEGKEEQLNLELALKNSEGHPSCSKKLCLLVLNTSAGSTSLVKIHQ